MATMTMARPSAAAAVASPSTDGAAATSVGDIALTASCDEFVDGSIFRVKLHNFLTYSDAEFYPGPRLNLILGPNGTGKSSIVCALCVGLAGSTKLLGRADKVGQFVRHEKESGYTEIELYFERGNTVIRRNIYRDNKSSWQLNGRDATLKAVTAVMDAAKIQIDNLCQFLPQDKVGEFSRMNPVQLLRATETAVMDGDLAVTHDKIIELQSDMSSKERELDGARSSLELKKSENRHREKEVERIVDHEIRIQETDLMEKKCLWLEFEDMKAQVEELKNEKKRCRDALDQAKNESVAPLEELLEKETLKLERAKTEKTEVEREKRQLDDNLKREKQSVDALENAQAKTLSEVKELRNQHNLSKRKLERLESDLADWKRDRAQMPAEADLKAQKVELEQAQRTKEMEHAEVSSQREARARELVGIEDDARKAKYKLSKLEDEAVQRRLALQRVDPDSIRAADWVQRNQDRLRGKVWGPVVLEMQVHEALHAKYLEDTLPKWLMAALVTENKHDYDLILDELSRGSGDNNGQRVKVSVLVVENGRCNAVQRPFTHDQLDMYRREFGISGFLDELVNAPDVIHEVLRAHGGIHTVLVGTRETEDIINRGGNIFQAIAAPERKAAFVTPFKKYVTSVSKYGDRNVTTRTNDLQNPRLLAASSSNEDEKHQLKSLLDDYAHKLTNIQHEINDLKAQERAFAEDRSNSSHRITEIRSQLKSLLRMDEKIAEGENKIYSLRGELARDLSAKEEAMIRKLKGQAAKQARHLKECLKLTKELLRTSARDAMLALRVGAQQVRREFTARQLQRAEQRIRELQDAFKRAKDDLMAVAKKAMQLKRLAEDEAPWDEFEDAFSKLSDDLEDLRGCIENNKASLECFRGDISVREIYARVAAEIATEEAELQELEDFVNNGEARVNEIKESWHSTLKDVVSKIDASFQEFFQDIGCVGEIVLDDEDVDLAKWGIQRRAQFRKNTKLSTMTAEEQSGGEKSVGTIMYLMALQSLTKCPFRVVDEINQGMDVYNERKVFQRITKSSCGSKMPQYFLITPKLITGLSYHRDTKVMVILNGPWNKIKQELWDTTKFVQCGQRLKRSGGASGSSGSSSAASAGPTIATTGAAPPAKKRARVKADPAH